MTDKKLIKNLNIAFIDTETTGLSYNRHEIIEIAAIIYSPREDKIIKEWESKAKPRTIETADQVALIMNGYNKDPESYTPDIKKVITEFNSVIEECIIAGQNVHFDIGFISKYYEEFGIGEEIDRHRRLEISSVVWPVVSKTDIKSLNLYSLCEHFGISNENIHRALTDCRRTLEVYKCAMQICGC